MDSSSVWSSTLKHGMAQMKADLQRSGSNSPLLKKGEVSLGPNSSFLDLASIMTSRPVSLQSLEFDDYHAQKPLRLIDWMVECPISPQSSLKTLILSVSINSGHNITENFVSMVPPTVSPLSIITTSLQRLVINIPMQLDSVPPSTYGCLMAVIEPKMFAIGGRTCEYQVKICYALEKCYSTSLRRQIAAIIQQEDLFLHPSPGWRKLARKKRRTIA